MSEGIVLKNEKVEDFIAEHGEPTRRKAHGADQTVLYYEDDVEDEGAESEVDVLHATNVANLADALADIDDAALIEKAMKSDGRKSAGPKYRTRLKELE